MDAIAAAVPGEKLADRVERIAQRGEARTWFGLRSIFDLRLSETGQRYFRLGEDDGHMETPIPPQFWPQY